MLIKRVYEIDPMVCPYCGGEMNVVAFIPPPQRVVIEKILQHFGLMQAASPRPPPEVASSAHNRQSDVVQQPSELTYVDMDTFLTVF